MPVLKKINLVEKFGKFSDLWNPKIIGELHGIAVKVAKIKGEFSWHHHDKEDELFWVIKGRLIIHLRDGDVILNPGELLIVPKKVEHKPEAKREVEIVLIEPSATVNTGNVRTNKTTENLEKI